MRRPQVAIKCLMTVPVWSLLAAQSSQFPAHSSPGSAVQAAAQASRTDAQQSAHTENNSTLWGILSDTQGTDFGPYLSALTSTIKSSWVRQIPLDDRSLRVVLAIELTIRKDGSLGPMKLAVSSGEDTLDRAAWNSVIAAAPFAALPTGFKGTEIRLRMGFLQNPHASDIVHLRNTLRNRPE